jgi:hypothetical protein
LLIASAVILFLGSAIGQDSSPVLKFGVVGSDPTGDYTRVMSEVPVQKALLAIADQPRSREFIDTALKGTNVSTDELVTLHLIKQEKGSYRIAFNLFTLDDDRRVREAAGRYARSLADGILKRRPELERLLANYNLGSVSKGDLAYVLIGCFGLDWDGQDIALEEKRFVEVKEPEYDPWAVEIGLPLTGIYWGSHSQSLKDVRFTSFGDHQALPRMALPDLIWRLSRATEKAELAPELLKSSRAFADSAMSGLVGKAGLVMLSLRSGPKTSADLASAASVSADDLSSVLDLVTQLQYIRRSDGRYEAIVPVLTAGDRPMVNSVRQVIWNAMDEWLRTYYDALQSDLKGITPLRNGVSYREHVYLQVWHYVFGITNGDLVRSGFFSSPYAPERRYKGFIPMVWDPSLENLTR